MSVIFRIDDEWLVERMLAGKTAREVGDEIDAMIRDAMQKEGQRVLAGIKEMMARSTVSASETVTDKHL